MKKIIAILLAALLALPLLTVGAMAQGEEISMFWGGGTPLSIDPALNSASAGSNIIRFGHAGLMGFRWVDGVAKLAPELAEGYTLSEDGKTYVFTLREGLKWSDGTDFTASQLKAAWDRASSEELGADYGFMYDVIEGYAEGSLNVVADDAARTVTVQLVSPTPYFLELTAFPTFYPIRADLADNEGVWATNPDTYIGMGAFKMTRYAVDNVIVYEKNPYYWDADSVSVSKVNCLLSEDNVAILSAYESGTALFIDSLDPTEYDRLNATYPGELNFGPQLGTYYVLFNAYKDYSPLGKQLTVQEQSKARFAIGQLVNRYELVTYVTKGGQVPATGFYPATLGDGLNSDVRSAEGYSSWYVDTDTASDINDDLTVDQAAALQSLVDLGYAYTGSIEAGDIKFTDFPTIEFSFNNSGANALIIQYVQETWNSFGIQATVNTEAWATLQQKLKAGDAEAARMGWIADFNDCVNFLEIFISNSGNNYPRLGKDVGTYAKASETTKDAGVGAYWGLNGDQTWAEAFDTLVTQIKLTADPAERAKLCAQGEEILMATGCAAPLYFYTRPYMVKPSVKNLIMMPTGDVVWSFVTIE